MKLAQHSPKSIIVLICFLFLWQNTDQHTREQKRVYLPYASRHISHGPSLRDGTHIRAGTQKRTCNRNHGGVMLLASLVGSRWASLLTQPMTTCTGNGATHPEQGPPTSINSQGDPTLACPQVSTIWTDPQVRLSYWVSPGCVKLTLKANWDSCVMFAQCAHKWIQDLLTTSFVSSSPSFQPKLELFTWKKLLSLDNYLLVGNIPE